METFIMNTITILVLFLGLWIFPKMVERFISLMLGIIAIIKGGDKEVNKRRK